MMVNNFSYTIYYGKTKGDFKKKNYKSVEVKSIDISKRKGKGLASSL